MMRAAAELQAEEQSGRVPPGNAVANTVARALDAFPLPPGAAAGKEHRDLLVAIEIMSLPEGVRRLLGV